MDYGDDDNNFTFFGTELDPIKEDDVVRKKPLRIEDEVAKDEQGRRRFHGAFTGGFSAGYYNTVGSKDGWAPTTFKSTRDRRGEGLSRRPEDFMDDEDRGVFGIAPEVIRPTDDFRDKSSKKRRPLDSTGTIPGMPVLHDLLRPVKETIGVRLLRSMGWNPGQGVGERVTHREKKTRAKKLANTKVYGCLLPPESAPPSGSEKNEEPGVEEESDDETDIELDAQILYAPDDIPPFLVQPKENAFGLGYVGLAPKTAEKNDRKRLLFEPTLSITDKNKRLRIAGQAFGVGAFEKEDEDIYAKDDMSRYDFELGASAPKEKRKTLPALTYNSPHVEGFEPAKDKPPVFKVYPPPTLPQNFAPFHKTSRSRWDIPPELYYPLREIQGQQKPTKLSAVDRGKLIANLKKEIHENRGSGGRFQPFLKDPPKQDRYEAFMVLTRLGKTESYGLLQPLTMTEWEKGREVNEFERASTLFKPMRGAIGNRFVSGGQVEESVPGGLGVFDPNVHQVREIFPVRMDMGDERKNAARMKLYGKMTREMCEWHPDRMLCIRFNVPNPFPELADIKRRPNRPVKRDKYSIFDFLNADSPDNIALNSKPTIMAIEPPKTVTAADLPSEPFATAQKTTDSQSEPSKVEKLLTELREEVQGAERGDSEEETKGERPPMDLFKAIFENDSEDEAKEESKKPKPVPAASQSRLARASQQKPNIFASLDAINRPLLPAAPSEVPADSYGPKMPPQLGRAPANPAVPPPFVSSRHPAPIEEEWVEVTGKAPKKSKKQKHKKAKKKKSKTHKKSKRKSHPDSSSDDSNSDLDAMLSSKLKKLKKKM
nr:EOG090X013U [Lepidurus arcticus]